MKVETQKTPEIISPTTRIIAAYRLDYRDGHFVDLEDGSCADEIVACYSRMKFGSVTDRQLLAREMALAFLKELDQADSQLLIFFQGMAERNEHVVIFAPAFRNVESASNKLIETATQLINLELAKRGLPTVVVSKLTRLFSNPANYATLSSEERAAIKASGGIIYPGDDYSRLGVHAIFGDDVKVTGSTANNLRQKCLTAGVKSFIEFYTLTISEETANSMPEIEEKLNRLRISGSLDEEIVSILKQADFRPVQRLLRLILTTHNRGNLTTFLMNPDTTPDHALVRLYLGAVNNDYGKDERYVDSVKILCEAVKRRGLVDASGWPINFDLL